MPHHGVVETDFRENHAHPLGAKVDASDAAVNLKEKLAVYNELDAAGLKV